MRAFHHTLWARANRAMQSRDYKSAIALYEEALYSAEQPLKARIRFNLEFACRRAGVPLPTKLNDLEKPNDLDKYYSCNQIIATPSWETYPVEEPRYVPRLLSDGVPVEKAIRVIAFYLPQFHRIPENDAWWGTGFTEWTNVRPAKPQFKEHYQPHVPDDYLGYYDLSDTSVMHKQIGLAKQYGIQGFCFYLYWFSGRKLLEQPLDNYLAEPSLDLPFCVCWANENWTRRWDGLDQDVLIEQQYSAEDDINFITNAAKYLRDPRYIRINGRPLLLVYRPKLFPDMKSTSKRWREWCIEHGIGDIYLTYPQSFETVDPAEYGFDAACEFPPNNSTPPNITHTVRPQVLDSNSSVYEWRVFLERSENFKEPGYKLFRSVTPSWDNTARKKNSATVFKNSSPNLFRIWLSNAMWHTSVVNKTDDEKIVFVNAWNEWAEGAHLEPDEKYGYAYLQSVADAHLEIEKLIKIKLAVVIHAFYIDLFKEILDRLNWMARQNLHLYVTTIDEHKEEVARILEINNFDSTICINENRGRDVLPFIKIIPDILSKKFDLVIKVHTKKSLHRNDGEEWRSQLYGLLSPNIVLEASRAFLNDELFGIAAPADHIVPLGFYWGSNSSNVEILCKKLKIDLNQIDGVQFAAGTMFIINPLILSDLKKLELEIDDFDVEDGQVDGTMAHAVERMFGIICKAKNRKLIPVGKKTMDYYKFADRS